MAKYKIIKEKRTISENIFDVVHALFMALLLTVGGLAMFTIVLLAAVIVPVMMSN